ncbi:F-box family protein [Quillaja saponaria]|uniref:F-box family protein n=1 Tax=Quillaja saponaria TaxID=32244 RepID=A0AAD7M481_QUISA|nr:F-box family protein [Quillaja saponaria]
MATLPFDVIVEILTRLPVKSLARFRVFLSSCCRLRLQTLNYEIVITNDVEENSAIVNLQSPLEMGSDRPARILGSCNGLVSLGLGEKKIIIWNPSIGDFRIFQDTDSNGSYGLGYDSVTDDYKLIKVFARNGSNEIGVDVFALKTHSWRSIRYSNLTYDLVDKVKVGTFLNGSIYWLVKHGDAQKMASIISFDLQKEQVFSMPLPHCGIVEGWRLGVLTGSLSACHCVYGKDAEVWMKGSEVKNTSWIKLGSVPQEAEPEYIRDYLVPLCFAKNGEAVMLKGGMKINTCNLKKNTSRRIFCYYDVIDMHEFDGAFYAESLVSPNWYDNPHDQTSLG